jgi:hypothetical protein
MLFLFLSTVEAQAQTGARVTFGVNPTIFRAGQPANAELSVTSVGTSPLTLPTGNTFTFFLDNSVGAVGSFTPPVSVSSASLVAGDFSVSFGANQNQVVLTYNSVPKTFAFGDSLSVKIGFIAAALPGTGKVSLSSQFVSVVNGALPFTMVSVVDFANSGISAVVHDQSLIGDGTSLMPLGIAPAGVTNPDIAVGAVAATNIAAGQVVKSLNGFKDDVSILPGANVTVAAGPGTLTLSAPNVITSVTHDATLAGSGTGGSPLTVAVPLTLKGIGFFNPIVSAVSTGGGPALDGRGGPDFPISGHGIRASGGDAEVNGTGGNGGTGLEAFGGGGTDPGACNCVSSNGGDGIFAVGGGSRKGFGGNGIEANGGNGSGSGNIAGSGIVATAGVGLNGAASGNAGDFIGNVDIVGNVDIAGRLTKGSGSFKIDHPLDPENKYLYHSFVESPDMKNIYDGTVTTDAGGNAVITLPDWFEALNRDFRYQLTVIGTFAQAIVAEKIKYNRFTIRTSIPNVEVSWQVTGIRRDAYANMHRIPVEETKPDRERGTYLHPDAFNQPEEKNALMARHPAAMRRAIERDRRAISSAGR